MSERKLASILKEKYSNAKSPQDFFDSIYNICDGEEAVIMATGPTISKYSDEQYHDFLKDKNVFAVKQTFHKFPQYTDVHFFNCSNLPKLKNGVGYKYEKYHPFVVASSNFPNGGGRWPPNQYMHLFFKVPAPQICDTDPDTLWNSKKFEEALFENNLQRPCGPGIFLETVLFFVLHLGFKSIYTIGWDYSKTNESYGHFYNDGEKATDVAVTSCFASDNEPGKFIKFSDNIADWLNSKNVTLKIIGDISEISKKFERVEL